MGRTEFSLQITRSNKCAGDFWHERSRYWLSQGDDDVRSFSRSRRSREPLIIIGHGARLWVNGGCLLIRSGFTHFPQTSTDLRFFPNDSNRPSRITVLDGSGTISFDALDWLTRNEIPLVRINWRGEISAVVGSKNYAADPKKIQWQRVAQQGGLRIKIGKVIIVEKIKNSISTLKAEIPQSNLRKKHLAKLQGYLSRLRANKLSNIAQILGIEGAAAITYFESWQSLPIKWEGLKRKPIPHDWHRVGARSSVMRQKIKNRNASHPINAILNYAYAVLESKIRGEIISAGYDPSIGFLHTKSRDNSALVFDLMEPMRPVIDRDVLAFVKSNTFMPNDFTIRSDGVCRLNPNLAAAIVALTVKAQNSVKWNVQLERLLCAL